MFTYYRLNIYTKYTSIKTDIQPFIQKHIILQKIFLSHSKFTLNEF